MQDVSKNRKFQNEGVASFYSGATVFLTGGTGFLGKVIIDKLLRSCEDIEAIFILIRPKRGVNIQERHKQLLNDEPFKSMIAQKPVLSEKIKPISGDISYPKLGLSEEDQEIFFENVNIIIHSAATVRFDEPLSVAINFNTKGTKNLIDLAYKTKNLKSFVYVSTAYSNSYISDIKETVYPVIHDPIDILECDKILPSATIDLIGPALSSKHPNTYTFTKQMSETLIEGCYGKLPITIVRPSIIMSSCKEPYPGWIDSVAGVTTVTVGFFRGITRAIYVPKSDVKFDYIPVDIVANTCIAAAWHHIKHDTGSITVYNCTSGNGNPVPFDNMLYKILEYTKKYPAKCIQLIPNMKIINNFSVYRFWESLSLFPCYFLDMWHSLNGKKPCLVRRSKFINQGMMTNLFFRTLDWNFDDQNMNSMSRALETTGEDDKFLTDISKINFEKYIEDYALGVRKFILKENIETLSEAKWKLRRLHLYKYCFILFCSASILKIISLKCDIPIAKYCVPGYYFNGLKTHLNKLF